MGENKAYTRYVGVHFRFGDKLREVRVRYMFLY